VSTSTTTGGFWRRTARVIVPLVAALIALGVYFRLAPAFLPILVVRLWIELLPGSEERWRRSFATSLGCLLACTSLLLFQLLSDSTPVETVSSGFFVGGGFLLGSAAHAAAARGLSMSTGKSLLGLAAWATTFVFLSVLSVGGLCSARRPSIDRVKEANETTLYEGEPCISVTEARQFYPAVPREATARIDHQRHGNWIVSRSCDTSSCKYELSSVGGEAALKFTLGLVRSVKVSELGPDLLRIDIEELASLGVYCAETTDYWVRTGTTWKPEQNALARYSPPRRWLLFTVASFLIVAFFWGVRRSQAASVSKLPTDADLAARARLDAWIITAATLGAVPFLSSLAAGLLVP
jgi:hypothetical protein